MKHALQFEILKSLMKQLGEGKNIDADVQYRMSTSSCVCPDEAAKEWSSFFGSHPQLVGLSQGLPGPGSMPACRCDIAPVPARCEDSQARCRGCRVREVGDMETLLVPYAASVAAVGYVAALMLAQLLVADVLGIAGRHVPGTPVRADHADPLFRATRAVANTNESIGVFVCALLFCLWSGAAPDLTAYAAWTYAGARTVYAGFYYANLQTLRSITFGISLLALLALVLVGALTG